MKGYQCDFEDCDTWSTNIEHFIVVKIDEEKLHFCCGWCMVRWGADIFEPTEVI